MKRRMLALCLLGLVASLPALAETSSPTPYDECESHFIAYLGAEAYQFSPAHAGELGTVRLFTVLSYQRAAAFGDNGRAFWKLEIRNEAGALVRAARGQSRIDSSGQAVADFVWDGRDEQKRLVPPGPVSLHLPRPFSA